MIYLHYDYGYLEKWLPFLLVLFIVLGISGSALTQDTLTQEKGKYLLGEDNRLEMVVHIIGEVKRPGTYRVPDNTNLIELLSEAGGPTEFSNLSSVTVTHVEAGWPANGQNGADGQNHQKGNRIINYNINKYLKEEDMVAPPMLRPSDVVFVPKNRWRTWRQVATIIRDLSVVASAYFLYLRATQD